MKKIEVLDSEQLKVVNSKAKNIVVVAGAGAGKTKVLTERVRYLIANKVKAKNIVCITFTNLAADEMHERLQDIKGVNSAFIGTIHAFAKKVLDTTDDYFELFTEQKNIDFHSRLIRKYCKTLKAEKWGEYNETEKKIKLGYLSEDRLTKILNTTEKMELDLLHRIKGNEDPNYPETIETLCEQQGIITFDELLRRATTYFASSKSYPEYVIVDEFQDVGQLEYNFIKSLKAKNYFLVGDEKQCQPKGTKILLADKTECNIEDLKVGQKIIGYDLSKDETHYFTSGVNRPILVEEISKRTSNSIITITTQEDIKTQYTPNHRCMVRLNKQDTVYGVYLMSVGDRFRVGKVKIFGKTKTRDFTLRYRLNAEKCDCAWLLKIFNNKKDAWIYEQKITYLYQIPQLIFQANKVIYTPKDVDDLYNVLGNVKKRAVKCLEDHGKSIDYPFIERNKGQYFSQHNVFELQAMNIFPRIMDVLVYDDKFKGRRNYGVVGRYENIKDVIIEYKKTAVYSLRTTCGHYVADKILTHNSIYGFKGGDVNIFSALLRNKDYEVHKLVNNYRNAKDIIELAESVQVQMSNITPLKMVAKATHRGFITLGSTAQLDELIKELGKSEELGKWFILTRSNKDLQMVADKLAQARINHISFKREGMSLKELRQLMSLNSVKLLTVHTSKGLENDNVIVFGKNFKLQRPDWHKNDDETKVLYVAITRAKTNLIILT